MRVAQRVTMLVRGAAGGWDEVPLEERSGVVSRRVREASRLRSEEWKKGFWVLTRRAGTLEEFPSKARRRAPV